MEALSNASVLVRATDLDTRDKGWSVVVPQIAEHRLRLELDPSVDAKRLMRSDPIGADIEVYYTQDLAGLKSYKRASIRKISE